jgi:hypothetical protein
MTFEELVRKSDAVPTLLVQIDIGSQNAQWTNYGAGIWMCDFDNDYPWIDATLLDGFSSQQFGAVGSVYIDGEIYTPTTLALLWSVETSFYYDAAERAVYIHFINNDEPFLHQVTLGIVYGFSYRDTIPQGTTAFYDGRLTGQVTFTQSRDPLFFGKIAYAGGNVTIINADGEYDDWGETEDIYGNEARVYYGFDELDFSEYKKMYVGYVEQVTIGEDDITVSVRDKRKQLTKKITYTCTAINAFQAIREILVTNLPIQFTDTYFNVTEWALAESAVDVISITASGETIISAIESICSSVFGLFEISKEGKYTSRVAQSGNTFFEIDYNDVLNKYKLVYDPSEVITSVKIGYNRDYSTTGNVYDYYTDDTREEATYLKYKTYAEQIINTQLISPASAAIYAETFLNNFDTVALTTSVEIPMIYYDAKLMDYVQLDIRRESSPMIGSTVFEVIGKTCDFTENKIILELRRSNALFEIRKIHTEEEREVDSTYPDRLRLIRSR